MEEEHFEIIFQAKCKYSIYVSTGVHGSEYGCLQSCDFLPYLSRVLESEWCLLVLRRAARCPLMGTVLIRSKCTLLLLPPSRAGPGGGGKDEKKGEGRRKDNKRKSEGKSAAAQRCGHHAERAKQTVGLRFPLRFRSLGKLLPVR